MATSAAFVSWKHASYCAISCIVVVLLRLKHNVLVFLVVGIKARLAEIVVVITHLRDVAWACAMVFSLFFFNFFHIFAVVGGVCW